MTIGRVDPLNTYNIPPYTYGTSVGGSTINTSEDVQDAIAPALTNTGLLTYNDATNTFDVPGSAVPGQIPVINGAGTGIAWTTVASSSETISGVAGANVVNGTLVKIVNNIVTTYQPTVDNPLSLVGIAMASVSTGGAVDVRLDGTVPTTHPTNGAVWAGPLGSLTSTVPVVGPVHLIGRVSAGTLILEISDPIL